MSTEYPQGGLPGFPRAGGPVRTALDDDDPRPSDLVRDELPGAEGVHHGVKHVAHIQIFVQDAAYLVEKF